MVRTPRPSNAVPDEVAVLQLEISRMTLSRKLRNGELTAPVPIPGSKRRWWRPADIELAREELRQSARYKGKAS